MVMEVFDGEREAGCAAKDREMLRSISTKLLQRYTVLAECVFLGEGRLLSCTVA